MNDANPNLPKKKSNICVRTFKKCFKRFYPMKPARCLTEQATWLQKLMKIAIALHTFFFVFSLALVGFKSMLFNLMLTCWAYSCYLTLSAMSCLLYLVSLILCAFYAIFRGLGEKTESYQQIGIVANAAFYIAMTYFIGKAYMAFRYSGGLDGL